MRGKSSTSSDAVTAALLERAVLGVSEREPFSDRCERERERERKRERERERERERQQ